MKIDLATGKISDFIRFDTGVIAMVTGGRNMGRVGVITHRERHDGGFNIVHIKDAIDNGFATRESNVFVIGKEKPWISLPKGKGVKVGLLGPFKPYFHATLGGDLVNNNRSSLLSRRKEIVVGLKLSLATNHVSSMAGTKLLSVLRFFFPHLETYRQTYLYVPK